MPHKIPSRGRPATVLAIVTGCLCALTALWLKYSVDDRLERVQARVGWMVLLTKDAPLEPLLREIGADSTAGPKLTRLTALSPTDPTLRPRLEAALREENGALSVELVELWSTNFWIMLLEALLVGVTGLGAYFQQSRLEDHLGAAKKRQHEAEGKQFENERLLSFAFDNGLFGMHLFDVRGKPLRSAPSITRRRGLKSFDFVALKVQDIRQHPILAALDAHDAFERATRGERVQLNPRRLTLPREDNPAAPPETIWVVLAFVPLFGSNGEVERVLAVTHDNTEQQNLRDQLLRAERLAEVGTLAAGVAHEVNNPLTFLAMNASIVQDMLLEEHVDREGVMTLLQDMDHGVQRIRAVTRELADLAHTTSDPMEPVELDGLIDQVVMMCQSELSETVTLDVELPQLPTVRLSPRRLEQIITNLIQNAARACVEDNGRILVRGGTNPGAECWISVTDNGVGMSEEVQERIFEPFFTTRRAGQGTGLGLYLVRCYVEELGGSIDVQSTLGEGTTVRITVPTDSNLWFSAIQADADLRLLVVSRTNEPVDAIRSLLPEVRTVIHASSPVNAVHRIRENPHWDRILAIDPHDVAHLRRKIADTRLRQRIVVLPDAQTLASRSALEQALELRSQRSTVASPQVL